MSRVVLRGLGLFISVTRIGGIDVTPLAKTGLLHKGIYEYRAIVANMLLSRATKMTDFGIRLVQTNRLELRQRPGERLGQIRGLQ